MAFGAAPNWSIIFNSYVERFQLPVQTGVEVVSVEQDEDEQVFIVKTSSEDNQMGPS